MDGVCERCLRRKVPLEPPASKHVLYIDCDGVPLRLEPALQAQTPTIDFSVADGHLSLSVMVPLTEEAAKFAGQLALVLADSRRGGR